MVSPRNIDKKLLQKLKILRTNSLVIVRKCEAFVRDNNIKKKNFQFIFCELLILVRLCSNIYIYI